MSRPYNLHFDNRTDPNIGTISIDQFRELQRKKEENEIKFDPCDEVAFMKNDKENLQKVLVATLTDTVRSKTKKNGRPKKT